MEHSRWIFCLGLILIAGCAATPVEQAPQSLTSSTPEPTQEFHGAAAGSPLSPQDELVEDMKLDEQAKRAASDQALEAARRHMSDLRYQDAENQLRRSLRLNAGNEEARRLLNEVLFILGDRSGEISTFGRSEAEREKVRQRQAVWELEKLYSDGVQEMLQEEKLEDSVRSFDMVLERIRWFPYNVDLSDLKTRAEQQKASAQQKLEEYRINRRIRQEEAARVQAESESGRSLEFAKNRISELFKAGLRAYKSKRYERAIRLADRVLEMDRRHQGAKELRARSHRLRHLHRTNDLAVRAREEWENTFLRQMESAVPYNEIFNFPSKNRWKQLSKKSVSLLQRARRTESSEEAGIRAQMETAVDVEFEEQPFDEVIDFLAQISGINFVLTKEARDALEDDDSPVNLPAVKSLPLKNVLRLVLESRDPKFSYTIRHNAILIGPSDSIRDDLYLEFYEVSDITKSAPDFPAPKLALDSGEDGDGGGGSLIVLDDEEGETGKTTVGPDILVELLEKTLWGEDGPESDDESVEYQGGKLVARTTLGNHQKIQRLLDALRKSTGIMVTVESRFIDLQENFLEVIGVDFGSPFNTNLPNPIDNIDGAGSQISPGYEFVDAQGQTDVRAAVYNAFSLPIGSSVAPFEISEAGGFALQYNVLDTYILEAIIEMNAKTQEFKRLDAPRVTAFNTQTSHSLVIDQAAYIKDAEVNQTGVIPVINPVIGVLNAGSILQVRPTVSYDRKYINLEIEPTLAVQLPSRFKRLILGLTDLVVEFPVLSVTQIKTTVTIPDGGTVLVGGLKRTVEQDNRVGPPWTQHLPGLEYLFGRKGQSRLMSTLFVLINAKITIIRDEEKAQFN